MRSPATNTPARLAHSIRRTSHIDMHLDGAELTLNGAARDLITDATRATEVGSATVRATVGTGNTLIDLAVSSDNDRGAALIGLPVAGGFRSAVRAAFADEVAANSPLALLLDDLPVATLISGYARLYSGDVPADTVRSSASADICSGWRSDGTMMHSVRAGDGVPVTIGPTAPSIAADHDVDPFGWHQIGPLAAGAMRRRRLVDVHLVDGVWRVNAMFRDTHVERGGAHETVLHEYALTGSVDAQTQRFVSCSAVPRVLPWIECPVAAASADRLVGQLVEATRSFVGRELRGISTCTHLNDLLRSLGDIDALTKTLGAFA
jgi:hypothetical protein